MITYTMDAEDWNSLVADSNGSVTFEFTAAPTVECLACTGCNGAETCVNGMCVDGSRPCFSPDHCDETTDRCVECLSDSHCSDGNVCTDDDCSGGTCYHSYNTRSCDDHDDCTEDDVCSGGICEGTPCDVDEICCSDGCKRNCCHDDDCGSNLRCDTAGDICVECLVDAHCDDAQDCNGTEWCDAVGDCQDGTAPCPGQLCCENGDGVLCADVCCEGSQCAAGESCDVDGDFCYADCNDNDVPDYIEVTPGIAFHDEDAWDTYEYGDHCSSPDCDHPGGYSGAVFDGRYIYFAPWRLLQSGNDYHGEVLRYDTQGAGFDDQSSWAAFDPGANGVGTDPDGFSGAIYDGRYVYFVPYYNGSSFQVEVLRYDTQAVGLQFSDNAAWTTFNVGQVSGAGGGYQGGTFDGRYIYFAPYYNGSTHYGGVLRYDTTYHADFSDTSAWISFDPGASGVGVDPDGYCGAVLVGDYIYFAPEFNGIRPHGEVLRFNLAHPGGFTSTNAWATYDYNSACNGSDDCFRPAGYHGAVTDGRYVYFVPYKSSTTNDGCHSEVLRYDTASPFGNYSSWAAYDPEQDGVGDFPRGYSGGVYDGSRYIYFAPYRTTEGSTPATNYEVLRYDTTMAGDFSDSARWSTMDPNIAKYGFDGAVFDGQYVYFVPRTHDSTYHGQVLRFNTQYGAASDCNDNSIPDECEANEDCNANGVQDICDIAAESSEDCNANDSPDECDISSGISNDCQPNDVPDECDIATGYSQDGNGDGIPDECSDCNNNGVWDVTDIASGASSDCQQDAIPDDCQLADNDCNANSVPDECDIAGTTADDCDLDGIPDPCQLTGNDCNTNGVPDNCDLAAGISTDCNINGTPDECDRLSGASTDCQPNGILDECDIAASSSEDLDEDGIPDECEEGACCRGTKGIPCGTMIYEYCVAFEGTWQGKGTTCGQGCAYGDFDDDSDVDLADFGAFQGCYTGADNGPIDVNACGQGDFDGDDDIDLFDYDVFTLHLDGPPAMPMMMSMGVPPAPLMTASATEQTSAPTPTSDPSTIWTEEEAAVSIEFYPVGGTTAVDQLQANTAYEVRYTTDAQMINAFYLGVRTEYVNQMPSAIVAPTVGDWAEVDIWDVRSSDEVTAAVAFWWSPTDIASTTGHLCTITTGQPGQVHFNVFLDWTDPENHHTITAHQLLEFTVY